MRYMKLHKTLAVVTAVGLIAATPMAASADTVEQILIEGKADPVTKDAVYSDKEEIGIYMHDSSDGTALNGDVTVNNDVTITNERTDAGSDSYSSGVNIWSDKDGGSATVNVKGSLNVDATFGDSEKYAPGTGIATRGAEADITIDKDVTATTKKGKALGVSAGGGATINIGGNVNTDSELYGTTGIELSGNNTVTVGENVEARGTTNAPDSAGGDADTYRSTGVNITQTGSKIEIGGSVIAKGYQAYGIDLTTGPDDDGNVVINVGGDVKASGCEVGYAISSDNNKGNVNINVSGDVEVIGGFLDSPGVSIQRNDGSIDINVGGDIKSSGTAINISDLGEGATTKITAGGTISAASGYAIYINRSDDSKEVDPKITAWKIESSAGNLVKVHIDHSSEDSEKAEERIKSNINYIIKADATENGTTSSNGKIVLTGTSGKVTIGEGDKAKTYDTAHQGEKITINVEVASGYKYSLSNGKALLTANPDGSYTITVPAGGGVDLKAVLEKIEEQKKEEQNKEEQEQEDQKKDNSAGNSGRYSSGSSSDSASGSLSGSPAIIYAPGRGTSGDTSWSYDNTGWRYKKPDGTYARNEWCELGWNGASNWYHFNSDGYADGGWYTDTDGQRYYLYNNHDGAFGRMLTGWNEIDGLWYYFNNASAGTASLGSLLTNAAAPDGYKVNAAGVWVQTG